MHFKKILIIFLTLFVASKIVTGGLFAANSQMAIEFEPGDSVTDPVDPDNPDQPLVPGGGGTGEQGPLSLDYVPALDFGSHKLGNGDKTYHAKNLKPFIQVTDNRGLGSGWKVKAKASNFTDGTKTTLLGSSITLKNGEALSANETLVKPVPVGSIVLPTDDVTEAAVLIADIDQGLGTWINRWYPESGPDNDNVTLSILSGSGILGQQTGTIT